MNGKLKVVAIIAGLALLSCGIFTAYLNSLGRTSEENLDGIALIKGFEALDKSLGVIDHSLVIIQQQNTAMTVQTILFAVGIIAVVLLFVGIIKGLINKQRDLDRNHRRYIDRGGWDEPQQIGGPRYLILGEDLPSLPYLLSQPDNKKREVLAQLESYKSAVEASLPRQGLLGGGKKVRWG